MTLLEWVLGIALAVALVAAYVGFTLARRYYHRAQERQSRAYQIGGQQVRGDMYQLLGEFAVLNDYEQIMTLSSTSRQGSLDLIGVKADSIDFIEFKKKGAALHGPERRVKQLVDAKKVNYVIKDVDLPQGFTVSERGQGFKPSNYELVPFKMDEDKEDPTEDK